MTGAERRRVASRRRATRFAAFLLALGVATVACTRKRVDGTADRYDDDVDHFKYGSIGSDIENGMPIAVLAVLPRMFPEYLPKGTGPRDYRAFGFIKEEGRPLPIGFSRRRGVVELTGLNCAVCHVGEVRDSPTAKPRIYLGMPANPLDLQAFFDFLFRCAEDRRFTPERLLAEMKKDRKLDVIEHVALKLAIPQMKQALLTRRDQLARFLSPDHPLFGPGRVDTFNPYKVNQFAGAYPDGIPPEERIGTVDFPAVWNQAVRENLWLHWDGNNDKVEQRNVSAAFGAGATRDNIDLASIGRVKRWLDSLPPPRYPYAIDSAKASRGQAHYDRLCKECHSPGQPRVGNVVRLDEIRTDRHRLDSYTEKLQKLQVRYSEGYQGWSFSNFRKTDGYACQLLDGIWARAPYLHNGSVPTLWDLLQPAAARPVEFTRGHGVYDRERVGFKTDVQEVDGRSTYRFDTRLAGNGNQGHEYGTALSEEQKRELIEYLKTL